MKKITITCSVLISALSFIKCGPAAEDRFKMHQTADHIEDSITKVIDAALIKGAIPGTTTVAISDSTNK